MKSQYCRDCDEPCSKQCPVCLGEKYFIGSGIESVFEPHFYNMAHPSKLPCEKCKGEGLIYCPYYREENSE
jgi:hypothetical protein